MEGNSSESDTSSEFSRLPEACIVYILGLTSPLEVCKVRSVARWLLQAVESDVLWLRFLPEDYLQILARSPEFTSLRDYSKKDLFFRLCNSPLLIDEGKKMFWLEIESGKKCYMLGARELLIIWGDTPEYWEWIALAESRFPEIAFLRSVCWLQIKGTVDGGMLSRETNYGAYLVFKLSEDSHGFGGVEVKSSMKAEGDVNEGVIKSHYLERRRGRGRGRRDAQEEEHNISYPTRRKDGWLEIEVGDFFTTTAQDADRLEVDITQLSGHWKRGLIVEGIEIRPKHLHTSSMHQPPLHTPPISSSILQKCLRYCRLPSRHY